MMTDEKNGVGSSSLSEAFAEMSRYSEHEIKEGTTYITRRLSGESWEVISHDVGRPQSEVIETARVVYLGVIPEPLG